MKKETVLPNKISPKLTVNVCILKRGRPTGIVRDKGSSRDSASVLSVEHRRKEVEKKSRMVVRKISEEVDMDEICMQKVCDLTRRDGTSELDR